MFCVQFDTYFVAAGGGPCFGGPASASQGRGAIRKFLVHRQPSAMMGQPTQGNFPSMGSMPPMSRSMMRSSIRASQQPSMYSGTGNMQGPMPGQMYNSSMGGQGGPGQGNMSQYSYQQSTMGGNQMMGQGPGGGAGGAMMNQNFQQGYQNPSAMMNMRQQSYMGGNMSQGQMVTRVPYMQVSCSDL